MNDVMTWTVLQLMTDTAVLEQTRAKLGIWDDLEALRNKLDAIIARESSYA